MSTPDETTNPRWHGPSNTRNTPNEPTDGQVAEMHRWFRRSRLSQESSVLRHLTTWQDSSNEPKTAGARTREDLEPRNTRNTRKWNNGRWAHLPDPRQPATKVPSFRMGNEPQDRGFGRQTSGLGDDRRLACCDTRVMTCHGRGVI
jgi:hypothetical protein